MPGDEDEELKKFNIKKMALSMAIEVAFMYSLSPQR